MASTGKDWLVNCGDVAGRRRDIIVFADHGRVVMVVPAGETAVLTPLEVGRLRAVLRDALVEGGGRKGPVTGVRAGDG